MTSNAKLKIEIEKFVHECITKSSVYETDSKDYISLEKKLADFFNPQFENFGNNNKRVVSVPFFNDILWPDLSYGNLDSSCFFGITEFLVWINYIFPKKYKSMWDVGAHVGIDTILMGKKTNSVTS